MNVVNPQNRINPEINVLSKQYQEKADKIIRKMLNVLVQAHKKVDDVAYQQWIDKLKGNNL